MENKMWYSRKGVARIVEVVLVLGIIAILATIGTLSLQGFREAQRLESAARELTVRLRDAQERAITQEDGEAWGIRFEEGGPMSACPSPSDCYLLFRGSVFLGGGVAITTFDSGVEFDSFTAPEIYFERLTGGSVDAGGVPRSVTVWVRLAGADCAAAVDRCRGVTVQANGLIARESNY